MEPELEPTFQIEISPADDGKRVDTFLYSHLTQLSRTLIQKMIRNGQLEINKVAVLKSNHKLGEGEVIKFRYAEPEAPQLEPRFCEFEILFEDECLLIINKPPGLLMHPGAGRSEPTLIEGVLHHLGGQTPFDDGEMLSGRPGIVHRIDADTSGVVVVAKNSAATRNLAAQFKNKSNLRIYKALVCGHFQPAEIDYESWLHRDPNHRTSFASISSDEYSSRCANEGKKDLPGYKQAKSFFKLEESFFNSLSLVSCKLSTGRTHQIRVQAKAMGFPVVGDPIYGGDHSKLKDPRVLVSVRRIQRQLLHAETLGIVHPLSGEKMAFQAEPPQDFRETIEFLRTLD
ncbi:RluA family pseudouridine synthase [Oligoflexaceae bacterium]|nr:RluA family pseudouridine synthase [Oligoflexaceae bacterium]